MQGRVCSLGRCCFVHFPPYFFFLYSVNRDAPFVLDFIGFLFLHALLKWNENWLLSFTAPFYSPAILVFSRSGLHVQTYFWVVFFYDLEGKKKINVIEPLIGRFRPFSRGCIQFSLRSLWLFQKELSPVRKPEPCGKPGGFQLPPWPPTITNPPSTAPTLSSDLLDCVGVKDSHRTTRPCGFFSNLFHWTEPDLTGLSGSSLAL